MKWDEEVFGLELDLDQYMIVAVGDFNMGAMENKGLNIFNTKYVLARPDTATDTDFLRHRPGGGARVLPQLDRQPRHLPRLVPAFAEGGAHRLPRPGIRCRHVFAPGARIQEVRGLRAAQFPEDAGPMAHPVRPQSYMEISNFYTSTVYEKGAEVVRMIHTLIGKDGFRRGMDLYFQRHDGQAVTTDDFVAAMADASGVDLDQFKRWYDQAGTPVVRIRRRIRCVRAHLYADAPPVLAAHARAEGEAAVAHPVRASGWSSARTGTCRCRLGGEGPATSTERVLSLTERRAALRVRGRARAPGAVAAAGILGAGRSLKYDYSDSRAGAADGPRQRTPSIAGKRVSASRVNMLLRGDRRLGGGKPLAFPEAFAAAFARVLANGARDPAFAAEALALPSESISLPSRWTWSDPEAHPRGPRALRRTSPGAARANCSTAYQQHLPCPDHTARTQRSAGQRALRNAVPRLPDGARRGRARAALAMRQFEGPDNMTDAMAALSALANTEGPERAAALERSTAVENEPLVVDKWLRRAGNFPLPGTLRRWSDSRRMRRSICAIRTRCMRCLRGFAANHVRFHAADGAVTDSSPSRSSRSTAEPAGRRAPRPRFRPLEKFDTRPARHAGSR